MPEAIYDEATAGGDTAEPVAEPADAAQNEDPLADKVLNLKGSAPSLRVHILAAPASHLLPGQIGLMTGVAPMTLRLRRGLRLPCLMHPLWASASRRCGGAIPTQTQTRRPRISSWLRL